MIEITWGQGRLDIFFVTRMDYLTVYMPNIFHFVDRHHNHGAFRSIIITVVNNYNLCVMCKIAVGYCSGSTYIVLLYRYKWILIIVNCLAGHNYLSTSKLLWIINDQSGKQIRKWHQHFFMERYCFYVSIMAFLYNRCVINGFNQQISQYL